MDTLYEKTKGKFKLTVDYADDPESPRRTFDNVGIMCTSYKRYTMPNETDINFSEYANWEEVRNAIEKKYKPYVILPVTAYIHSGIALSTSENYDRWDGGQMGFIFTTKEQVKKIYGKVMPKKTIETVLKDEIHEYSHWLNGEVYEFTITNLDTHNVIEYADFFFNENEAVNEGLVNLNYYYKKDLEKRIAKRIQQLKAYIKNHIPLEKRIPFIA